MYPLPQSCADGQHRDSPHHQIDRVLRQGELLQQRRYHLQKGKSPIYILVDDICTDVGLPVESIITELPDSSSSPAAGTTITAPNPP